MTKKSQPKETAATAKFVTAHQSTAQLVDQTKKIADYVKGNPAYPATPVVQQAVIVWETSMQKLDKNDIDINAARVSLVSLISDGHAAVADWRRSTKSMLSVIDQVS